MNFKGIEVNALYASHLRKKINNHFNKCIEQTNKHCLDDKNRRIKHLLSFSFFNQNKKDQMQSQQKKPANAPLKLFNAGARKNAFSAELCFIWNSRRLLTLNFYHCSILKQKKQDRKKVRLTRAKAQLKKRRLHYLRGRMKHEKYRFFSMKNISSSRFNTSLSCLSSLVSN